MKKISFLLTSIILLTLYISACSDPQDVLTTADPVSVHKEGIGTIGSPDFHTTVFQQNNWNLQECARCHGADFSGGPAQSSCLTCHTSPGRGPKACNTCHGDFSNSSRSAPPTDLLGNVLRTNKSVGAHAEHIYENQLGARVSCFECHARPVTVTGDFVYDHIGPLPADMQFGTIASQGTSAPLYNAVTATCSNVYCHGNFSFPKSEDYSYFYTDTVITGNFSNVAEWTRTTGVDISCGQCHGIPPAGHLNDATTNTVYKCADCHIDVVGIVNGTARIIDKSKHINGKINVFGKEY